MDDEPRLRRSCALKGREVPLLKGAPKKNVPESASSEKEGRNFGKLIFRGSQVLGKKPPIIEEKIRM